MGNRIDRIDGTNYYEYTRVKNDKIPDTDEKFSLEYKRDETPSEPKTRKEKDNEEEVSEQEKRQSMVQGGVKLELSDQGRIAGRYAQTGRAGTKDTEKTSLLVTIQTFWETAVSAVKDFFYKLWNDPQPEVSSTSSPKMMDLTEASESSETSEAGGQIQNTAFDTERADGGFQNAETTYYMNEMRLDNKIQPYLRNGDLNQVINLLTDNGRKTIARNSTLLTYYDKNGRMVEPSASDRERILNGDRNARKL